MTCVAFHVTNAASFNTMVKNAKNLHVEKRLAKLRICTNI